MNKNRHYLIPKESLRFGSLGNGVTVYTTALDDPYARDYLTIAHISPEGTISWRVQVDPDTKSRVEAYAKEIDSSEPFPMAHSWLHLN